MKIRQLTQGGVDDEYYTLKADADKVAERLARLVRKDYPILCNADTVVSEIPRALRAVGFTEVTLSRDCLSVSPLTVKARPLIVTNPPWSVLLEMYDKLISHNKLPCVLVARIATLALPPFVKVSGNYRRPDGSIEHVATACVTNCFWPDASVCRASNGACRECDRFADCHSDASVLTYPVERGWPVYRKPQHEVRSCCRFSQNGVNKFRRLVYLPTGAVSKTMRIPRNEMVPVEGLK